MPFPVGEQDAHEVNPFRQPFEADGEAFGVMAFHKTMSFSYLRVIIPY